jgi:hypothetical protein
MGAGVGEAGPGKGAVPGGRVLRYSVSASAGGRSLSRCMRRWWLYQCTQLAVIFSRPPRVAIGPSRNGDPSRVHSALYRPVVVSARALS